jgi:tryptophanyl-tRNA synthetase
MTENQKKQVIFSGIQPSGHLTIGGYLGAIKNWTMLQNEYDCLFCIVDLHAITVRQDTKVFADRCRSFAAQYIAAGIDPEKAIVFIQSHVPAHTELTWLLNCHAYMGELSRMTQFKDKTQGKAEKNIGVGLFDYPVLMAADILLYQANLVPVGADQKQHLELTRDIAERVNNLYGKIFNVPDPYIPKVGARVMSLQDPTSKMSKSDPNENNFIAMLDSPEVIKRKIRKAVMDSIMGITYDPDNRPGVANLLSIFAAFANSTPEQIALDYADQGNAALKADLTDLLIESFRPFTEKYNSLMSDKEQIDALLRRNAGRARELAKPTLDKLYQAMGFMAP